MFVVIVKARVKPDRVELYETTFKALREKVLAGEPGVTFYELCRVPHEPCAYRLIECYRDEQAQQDHLAKDYYQEAVGTIIECLEGGSYEMEVVETI
jgi:quinol monooxygenase YgiN